MISANDGLISDCINVATQGIQQFVALKNVAKAISSEIQTKISKGNSADHEKDVEPRINNLYNFG